MKEKIGPEVLQDPFLALVLLPSPGWVQASQQRLLIVIALDNIPSLRFPPISVLLKAKDGKTRSFISPSPEYHPGSGPLSTLNASSYHSSNVAHE